MRRLLAIGPLLIELAACAPNYLGDRNTVLSNRARTGGVHANSDRESPA